MLYRCLFPPARQSGYSLLEMTIVMAVIGVLLQGFFALKQDLMDEAAVKRTVEGFALIDEALYAHRTALGSWPASIDALSSYLPNFQNTNGVGRLYSIRREGSGIVISTEMKNTLQQVAVASEFPVNGQTGDGTTVSIGLPLPGLESAHSQLLHLRGGTMQGNINMNNRSITNIRDARAHNLYSTTLLQANNFRLTSGRMYIRPSSLNSATCARDGYNKVISHAKSRATRGLVTLCGPSTDYQAVPLSSVQVRNGRTSSGGFVSPPTGYNIDQCALSVSGHANHPGRSGYASSYRADRIRLYPSQGQWRVFYSQGNRHCRTGCNQVNSRIFVDWQMVCSR